MPALGTVSANAKDEVLRTLRVRPYRPVELMEELQGTFSDAEIKEAVFELLDEKTLEFLPDRKLRFRLGG